MALERPALEVSLRALLVLANRRVAPVVAWEGSSCKRLGGSTRSVNEEGSSYNRGQLY